MASDPILFGKMLALQQDINELHAKMNRVLDYIMKQEYHAQPALQGALRQSPSDIRDTNGPRDTGGVPNISNPPVDTPKRLVEALRSESRKSKGKG